MARSDLRCNHDYGSNHMQFIIEAYDTLCRYQYEILAGDLMQESHTKRRQGDKGKELKDLALVNQASKVDSSKG